jgi:hypothetical protein
LGVRAHRFATAKINDRNIPGLLDVLTQASQYKRPEDVATREELKRLKQYYRLMEPTIGGQAKRIAEVGALRFKNILRRWWAARAETRERQFLRFAEASKRH